jgi:GPH family glycoside/pentoside/hexuronide:cation symporter
MYADCADYSEWRFNRRATGLVFSAAIMAQKLGWAGAGWITGAILTLFGYIANTQLTPEALGGILKVNTLVPALFGAAACVLIMLYGLTDKKMAEINAELQARRAKAG